MHLQLKRIVAIGVIAAAWTTDVLRAQTLNPPARGVIDMSRALTTSEIAQVLAASRDAVAGKTFRLAYRRGGPGPEILPSFEDCCDTPPHPR